MILFAFTGRHDGADLSTNEALLKVIDQEGDDIQGFGLSFHVPVRC
jgi:hypothetical protein